MYTEQQIESPLEGNSEPGIDGGAGLTKQILEGHGSGDEEQKWGCSSGDECSHQSRAVKKLGKESARRLSG